MSCVTMTTVGFSSFHKWRKSQALSAAAIVIKNILGLVYDPVAGLVEVPCAKRNIAGTVSALTTADLVMS